MKLCLAENFAFLRKPDLMPFASRSISRTKWRLKLLTATVVLVAAVVLAVLQLLLCITVDYHSGTAEMHSITNMEISFLCSIHVELWQFLCITVK